MPRASIIVNTYNKPEYLRLVLAALCVQTERDFEVIVGDDGSRPETEAMLRELQSEGLPFELKYHWQEDDGFRPGEARNGAIRLATADWLIFLDGDMVVHRRFVESHLRLAGDNRLLFGGRVKLTQAFSESITPEDILGRGITSLYYRNYFRSREARYAPVYAKLSDRVTDTAIQWVGGTYLGTPVLFSDAMARLLPRSTARELCFKSGSNFSTSRASIVAVNGFDKRFSGLSGEDGELFWRLHNLGVEPRSVLFTAIGYHLWHNENWQRVGEERDRALALERETIDESKTRCADGLVPLTQSEEREAPANSELGS